MLPGLTIVNSSAKGVVFRGHHPQISDFIGASPAIKMGRLRIDKVESKSASFNIYEIVDFN